MNKPWQLLAASDTDCYGIIIYSGWFTEPEHETMTGPACCHLVLNNSSREAMPPDARMRTTENLQLSHLVTLINLMKKAEYIINVKFGMPRTLGDSLIALAAFSR
jgi:hypothetical protein